MTIFYIFIREIISLVILYCNLEIISVDWSIIKIIINCNNWNNQLWCIQHTTSYQWQLVGFNARLLPVYCTYIYIYLYFYVSIYVSVFRLTLEVGQVYTPEVGRNCLGSLCLIPANVMLFTWYMYEFSCSENITMYLNL